MNLLMFNPILAAEEPASMGLQDMLPMILIYAAIIGGLYFFMIRPNSKKKKAEAELRNNLEIGDNVTTIGGIVGRVVAIKEEDDEIIIETGSDRSKLKMKRWCISTVDTEKETANKSDTAEKSDEKKEEKKKGFFSR